MLSSRSLCKRPLLRPVLTSSERPTTSTLHTRNSGSPFLVQVLPSTAPDSLKRRFDPLSTKGNSITATTSHILLAMIYQQMQNLKINGYAGIDLGHVCNTFLGELKKPPSRLLSKVGNFNIYTVLISKSVPCASYPQPWCTGPWP